MKRGSHLGLAVLAVLSGALCTALRSTRSSAELPSGAMREGLIEPVLSLSYSGLGGEVVEVCARPGDWVKKGQVLLRLDASELRDRLKALAFAERSIRAELSGRGVLERVPNRIKRYLYQTHPDVVDAEEEYVRALSAWEQAPESGRAVAEAKLAIAADQRTRAKNRLDRILATPAGQEELGLVVTNIGKNRSEVEQLLAEREVRAQADGSVDILDLRPGDRLLPRQPAATVRVAQEYTARLVMPAASTAQLQVGARVNGDVASAVVESVTQRKVPAAFREKRSLEDDTVVRVRFHSATAIVPGSVGRFYLP